MSPRPQATAQATGWRRASRTSLYVEGTDQNAEGDLKLEFKRPDDTLIWEDIVHYTAIAADCKNQPTTTYDPLYGDSQRGFFESRFPNLRRCEWSATAGATAVYHSIAWSIGVTIQWIWYQIDAAGDGDGVVEEREFDNFYDDLHKILRDLDLPAVSMPRFVWEIYKRLPGRPFFKLTRTEHRLAKGKTPCKR